MPPQYFQGFYKRAGIFGDPSFLNEDQVAKFVSSFRKERAKNAARDAINMITELRYTIAVLAERPILIDTGQHQAKYQNRTFADMENEIATKLTNQPNFRARVKLLSGEHTIQTKNYPLLLSGELLTERLARIQAQTRKNYCKPRTEVEKQIRQRQERLRGSQAPQQPPPTYYTSEEPPPTHF